MNGRPPAPCIVIVDNIVVNQCPGMKQLDSRRSGNSRVQIPSSRSATPHHNRWAQAFAGPARVSQNGIPEIIRLESLCESPLKYISLYLLRALGKRFAKTLRRRTIQLLSLSFHHPKSCVSPIYVSSGILRSPKALCSPFIRFAMLFLTIISSLFVPVTISADICS